MKDAGIHDGADLRARSEAELVNRFGKVGRHYFRIARGQDERAVSPDRPYKSIGAEETFERDLSAPTRCSARSGRSPSGWRSAWPRADLFGRTVTLKIKHHDFTAQHPPAHAGGPGAFGRGADAARPLAPAHAGAARQAGAPARPHRLELRPRRARAPRRCS